MESKTGMDDDEFYIIYEGKQLIANREKKMISDYNITDEATLHLSLVLAGGGTCCCDTEACCYTPENNYCECLCCILIPIGCCWNTICGFACGLENCGCKTTKDVCSGCCDICDCDDD